MPKRIVPLKFESWFRVSEIAGEYYQVLPGYRGIRLVGQRGQRIRSRALASTCPCCAGEIERVFAAKYPDDTGTMETYHACAGCGFFRFTIWDDVNPNHDFEFPFVAEFDARSQVASLIHLNSELTTAPERLYGMDPARFEIFVGSVLKNFYDCEVRHVGRAGDDGIDLVAIVADKPLMIQVKRRQNPDATEGIEVVKLLFASAFAQGADAGMVITTAQQFSRPARTWVDNDRLRDVGFRMSLVDINSLLSMMNTVRDKDSPLPWEAHRDRPRQHHAEVRQADWMHLSLSDGDALVDMSRPESMQIALWRHDSVESCYDVMARPNQLSNLKRHAVSVEDFLRHSSDLALPIVHLSGDQYFAYVSAIPEKAVESIVSRWRLQFPSIVHLSDF